MQDNPTNTVALQEHRPGQFILRMPQDVEALTAHGPDSQSALDILEAFAKAGEKSHVKRRIAVDCNHLTVVTGDDAERLSAVSRALKERGGSMVMANVTAPLMQTYLQQWELAVDPRSPENILRAPVPTIPPTDGRARC